MKITWFTGVISLMGVFTMAAVIQLIIIEDLKALVLAIPILITVYFYRKRVCYQCMFEDCPFPFKLRGNFYGFWLPSFLFLLLALVVLFAYNYIL